jgi:hypothetical protein
VYIVYKLELFVNRNKKPAEAGSGWLFYKAFPAPLVLVDYTNATLAVERAVNFTPRPAVTVTEPDFVDVLAFTLVCFFDRVTPILRVSHSRAVHSVTLCPIDPVSGPSYKH